MTTEPYTVEQIRDAMANGTLEQCSTYPNRACLCGGTDCVHTKYVAPEEIEEE